MRFAFRVLPEAARPARHAVIGRFADHRSHQTGVVEDRRDQIPRTAERHAPPGRRTSQLAFAFAFPFAFPLGAALRLAFDGVPFPATSPRGVSESPARLRSLRAIAAISSGA
jgi:hypothetical protein